METVLKVEGMSCSHCENRIKKAIESLGVEGTVNLETKEVIVKHNENISIESLIDAIDEAGYDAVIV